MKKNSILFTVFLRTYKSVEKPLPEQDSLVFYK